MAMATLSTSPMTGSAARYQQGVANAARHDGLAGLFGAVGVAPRADQHPVEAPAIDLGGIDAGPIAEIFGAQPRRQRIGEGPGLDPIERRFLGPRLNPGLSLGRRSIRHGRGSLLNPPSPAARRAAEIADPHLAHALRQQAQLLGRKKPTYFEHRDANRGPWTELYRGLIAASQID